MWDVHKWVHDNANWVVPLLTLHVPPPSQWPNIVRTLVLFILRRKPPMPDTATIVKAFHIISAAVQVAEAAIGPGNGAEKKAHALAALKEQIPTVAADLGLPSWLVQLLLNEQTLGLLIDFAVFAENKAADAVTQALKAADAPLPANTQQP